MATNLDIGVGAHGGKATLSARISTYYFPSIGWRTSPSLTEDLCQKQSLNPTQLPTLLAYLYSRTPNIFGVLERAFSDQECKNFSNTVSDTAQML